MRSHQKLKNTRKLEHRANIMGRSWVEQINGLRTEKENDRVSRKKGKRIVKNS